jgi:hypothetical protein
MSKPVCAASAAEENPQLARWGDLLLSSVIETLYTAAAAEAGLSYQQAYTDSVLGVIFYFWRVVGGQGPVGAASQQGDCPSCGG